MRRVNAAGSWPPGRYVSRREGRSPGECLPYDLPPLTTAPVFGLRMSGFRCGLTLKSSSPPLAYRLPELLSNEPAMCSPPSQLSSMNLTTEAVSVRLELTKFSRVYGEMTTIGSRWL